jgi:ribosome-associated protein
MIAITANIAIDERELQFDFVRASGPGGQNVNKVATAAQLRFDVRHSRNLSEEVRMRLINLAGKKMTAEGILVIEAKRFRSQDRNRQDAVDRLTALIRKAAKKPTRRLKTRPSKASRERKMEAKRLRSRTKLLRRHVTGSEE